MTTYFILGTDTGCGKTYATMQWIHHLKRQNRSVMALKPVASGTVWDPVLATEVNEDVMQLQAALHAPEHAICGWSFSQPLSPHLAAAREGKTLSIGQIASFCEAPWLSNYETVLIEGAGGLMVPLNDEHTWIDCLLYTKWPVVLVVGMRLGCLNHALLTAEVLKANKIPCVGWIANAVDPTFLAPDENRHTLQNKLPWPLLGHISYQGKMIVFHL